ncbi:hypothetical protein AU210_016778 [Fusarium oxysporum f. sp. radicis-cucumerinum]|uniref:Uncharacterized protein n=1 Tax=Fusarium oxysporum f. sp. radicis-cucumerinum TaxID=327505 RepID=A0A2H3FNH9_FUSOX|nr:hypothetical protein AU210_016778 [Fusarium oxysporum f. sp. radicis-cucumerinum]
MWDRCYFDPEMNPHVGQISRRVSLASDDSEHSPFWILPTQDLKALILTQAARLVLPLDHLFDQALAQQSVDTGNTNKGEVSVQLILSLYTAQLLCRLLIHTLNEKESIAYDNWIWLKEWVVRDRSDPRRFRLRRQGLGLDKSFATSGMLWIPLEAMDWCNGHISLRRLVDIYIPRSPLQSYLISQSNIQSVTTSKVTVEILLLQQIEEVRQLWEDGRQFEGKRLAYDTAKFATQEIARAYNLHLLHKLESMWDRLRAKKGRSSLPSLQRFKHNIREVAAQCSQKVTAQTIWEIYAEAWATYVSTTTSGENNSIINMPEELPCWTTSRNFTPPKDSWSEYVFQQLFNRSRPPTWNRVYFLQLYRTYKSFWTPIETHVGSFDDKFRRHVGRCIMVTFNSCHSKEVGTNHNLGTWYRSQPTFFQIQFSAPYFVPPQDNLDCSWSAVVGYEELCPTIDPDTMPYEVTAEDFQSILASLQWRWCKIMYRQSALDEMDPHERNSLFKATLNYLMRAVGPQWENSEGPPYTLPWILSRSNLESGGDKDPFRVPISASSMHCRNSDKLCRPTVFFPTQENIMLLVDVIKQVSGLRPSVLRRLEFAEELLESNPENFGFQSHFLARERAIAPTTQPESLLWRFLRQSDPHRREYVSMRAVRGVMRTLLVCRTIAKESPN